MGEGNSILHYYRRILLGPGDGEISEILFEVRVFGKVGRVGRDALAAVS